MGIVNNSSIADVIADMNRQFLTDYNKAFQDTKNVMDPLIDVMPLKSNLYRRVWMTASPAMRQWLGPRIVKHVEVEAVGQTTKNFEATIAIARDDVESDQYGLYSGQVAALGVEAKRHVDRQSALKLQAGTSDLGFDGLAVFSAAHDLDPAGVQSNLLTSTALSAANYAVAKAALKGFTDNSGNPFYHDGLALVVPPQLETTAKQIINASLVANGTAFGSNVLENDALVIVNPRLGNEPTVWYLMSNLSGMKPLKHMVFRQPNLTAKTAVLDDNVFWDNEFVYGVDCNDAIELAPWFQMIRCEG